MQDSKNLQAASIQGLSKHMIEGGFIVILALAILIFCSLLTHQVNDTTANAAGKVGEFIAVGFYAGFGYGAYLLPIFMFYITGKLLLEHRSLPGVHQATVILRAVGLLLFMLSVCGLVNLQMHPNPQAGIIFAGGNIGHALVIGLTKSFNVQGAVLILFAMFLVGTSWVTGLSWLLIVEWIGRMAFGLSGILMFKLNQAYEWVQEYLEELQAEKSVALNDKKDITQSKPLFVSNTLPKTKETASKFVPSIPTILQHDEHNLALKRAETPKKESKSAPVVKDNTASELPPLSLLSIGNPKKLISADAHKELEVLSRNLEQHLLDFGIQVEVVAVHPGPVITRFELQLAAGVKVSRLSALAKDLARSISVTSVRVVEVIPGKAVVGIEIPNPERQMVCLSEVLSAEVYQQAHSLLSLALGVDIAGHPMVVDLAKMPHLLVAGTTGSGKSVGINAMILSLLFKATPDQVRLIMIDPKMLELSIYDGIPHLLTPVVTDMKEAASALRWCVNEMERRYRLMAAVGVRNLAGFNAMVTEANTNGDGILDPLWKITDTVDTEAPKLSPLPYVVVIIDELADMMMVVGKKVEQLIARIAQKARAAGIHLILATQRPSVDVLTGLIKSNIPTRISFQVSSKIDSRTILDQMGADQLLGHGDMLFLAPGTGAPLRVHGAFVDDQEVHRVADAWRARGTPEYIEAITQISGDPLDGEFGEERANAEEADLLYDEAVAFVMQTRKASISSVQRRFKIGYNRAARLIEEMERCGLVGPLEGGFRDVLVNTGLENE